MKYYKLLVEDGAYKSQCKINKIYPGDLIPKNWLNNIEYHADLYPDEWKKVSAGEYFIQEGKLPEYFGIKIIKHPLCEKYIKWWKNEFDSNSHYIGDLGKFYGFDDLDRTTSLNAFIHKNLPKNAVELTLEQWNKIIN